jgi:hypothetical protein
MTPEHVAWLIFQWIVAIGGAIIAAIFVLSLLIGAFL